MNFGCVIWVTYSWTISIEVYEFVIFQFPSFDSKLILGRKSEGIFVIVQISQIIQITLVFA